MYLVVIMKKIKLKDVIDTEPRKKIYDFISKNPGLHFREISRELSMPASTLFYHIKYLIKRGFLFKEFVNGYSRYYRLEEISNTDKNLFNILREPVPRNIVLYLLFCPVSSKKDMITFAKKWKKHPSKIGFHLNKHRTTINFHIDKLIEEGILGTKNKGKEVKYFVLKPKEVLDFIIRYKESLLTDAYDLFLKYLEPSTKDKIDNVNDNLFNLFPKPFRS